MYNTKGLLADGVPLDGFDFGSHLMGGEVDRPLRPVWKMFTDIGLHEAITELSACESPLRMTGRPIRLGSASISAHAMRLLMELGRMITQRSFKLALITGIIFHFPFPLLGATSKDAQK